MIKSVFNVPEVKGNYSGQVRVFNLQVGELDELKKSVPSYMDKKDLEQEVTKNGYYCYYRNKELYCLALKGYIFPDMLNKILYDNYSTTLSKLLSQYSNKTVFDLGLSIRPVILEDGTEIDLDDVNNRLNCD